MSNKQAREPGEDDEPESFLPAVLQKFAVLAPGNENIVDILAQNLGGKQLSLFKLEKLGVAAQGMPFFVAKLGDEMEQVKEFDGIVLMMGRNRSFWLKSFEESGGGSPPDCVSDDLRIGMGDRDGSGVIAKHECATCPHNQWDSGANGVGKRCQESIAMLTARDDKPGRKLPSVVRIQPGSLRFADDYLLATSPTALFTTSKSCRPLARPASSMDASRSRRVAGSSRRRLRACAPSRARSEI